MLFTIVVHSSPENQQGSQSALNFSTAVLAAGHSIYRVFFYAQGVLNAHSVKHPDIAQGWSQLAKRNNIDLVLCSTSALDNGIDDESFPLAGFEISGLGQLTDACVHSDRTVTFH
jgi:tRNA 2-thiouridine synthesizing protein D